MAAIFKPLRGSRFRAACGASCAAQCVLRLLPTHSNLYALGPGEIGSRPVVCGAGPQGEARRGGVAAFAGFFSVLIPLSSTYSVLISVLIPVLIHGFAGRATRNKLAVTRF